MGCLCVRYHPSIQYNTAFARTAHTNPLEILYRVDGQSILRDHQHGLGIFPHHDTHARILVSFDHQRRAFLSKCSAFRSIHEQTILIRREDVFELETRIGECEVKSERSSTNLFSKQSLFIFSELDWLCVEQQRINVHEEGRAGWNALFSLFTMHIATRVTCI